MLESTFCHIPGIGRKTESRLWEAGVSHWDASEAMGKVLSRRTAEGAREILVASREALERGNLTFFADHLASDECWRLTPYVLDNVAYLDIETTGMSAGTDAITTIAVYDGTDVHHYVQGQNLGEFVRDIRAYRTLVTYSGKCFDVPFIEKSFDITLDQVHLDLRYILRSLGYTGGLKHCEKELGLHRGDTEGIDGFDAVRLWHRYSRSANPRVLETLLAYNVQDVLSLEALLNIAYNQRLRRTPFADRYQLARPQTAQNPFTADPQVVADLHH